MKNTVIERNEWNKEPEFLFKVESENYLKRKSLFFLSSSVKDSLHSLNWVKDALNVNSNHNLIEVSDISSDQRFLLNSNNLKRYLKEFTPNILIIQIDPSIISDFLEIPNFIVKKKQNTENLFDKSSIYQSIDHINTKVENDSIIRFNPFFANLGYKDSIPKIDNKTIGRVKFVANQISRNFLSLNNFCNKEGIQLVVVPTPILWRSNNSKDWYSKIPLDKIVLVNEIPTAWYADLYFLMLDEMSKNISSKLLWIDLYKSFPTDSRFFYDGFRLNETGQAFFGEMYKGKASFSKDYRSIFQ